MSAGRITAVGDEGDVAALIGPGTRVVDALTPSGQWARVVAGWTGAQFAEKRLPPVELSGEADVKGTISIGKYADFAVL